MNNIADKLGKEGERMVPELHRGKLIYAEHIVRYLVSKELVKGKVVLDIACGSGYGTKLLSENASKIYGIDVDEATIEYARKNYGAHNVEFMVGDGERIPLPDNHVDVLISYETIEHIKNYKLFMKEISRVLKKDGLAIISTPNDLEFAEGNHYHLHEFSEAEITSLVSKYFKHIDSYYQATWKYVAIGSKKDLNRDQFIGKPILNFSPVDPNEYLYFFLLCSNRVITQHIEPIAALGEHYSDRFYIGREMNHEKNINDYKIVQEELQSQKIELSNKVESLQTQLSNIMNSRRFKFLGWLGLIKSIVRINRKQLK